MSMRSQRSQKSSDRPGPSRSTYPSFIPIQDTLVLHLSWVYKGLVDAFRWKLVFDTVVGDTEIRSNVIKSVLLNSLSLTSIYTFDLLLFPLTRNQQRWFHRNVGWFYQILWMFPVVGLSFYLNSTWLSVIAKRTYALQYGSRANVQSQPVSYTGLLNSLATSAYRAVMVFTSILVSFVLGTVPIIGSPASFVFFCWVNSYYFFEFVWVARGFSFSRRIRHLEERWAYYLGFGLPSAAICTWSSSLANAALFALIFPVYVIMAMHARPVPHDPYNPVPPAEDTTVRYPSPFVPVRLPIFAIVIWVNEWLVWFLSMGGPRETASAGRRRMSEAAETVEEGEVVELRPVQGTWREARVGGVSRRVRTR